MNHIAKIDDRQTGSQVRPDRDQDDRMAELRDNIQPHSQVERPGRMRRTSTTALGISMRPASSSRAVERPGPSPNSRGPIRADLTKAHVRRPSGIVDAMARSPPVDSGKPSAVIHTSKSGDLTANKDISRQPKPPVNTNVRPSIGQASAVHASEASSSSGIPRGPDKTTVVMNIHMAAAFDREPVVTDLREIPWAKPGDIIEVRPVQRREWEPHSGLTPGGPAAGGQSIPGGSPGRKRQASAREEREAGEGKRTSRSERNRKGPKGHFLFRVGGNDETKLKKLQQPLSLSDSVAEVFGLANRMQVDLVKIDPKEVEADFIELTFTGQYLGRSDMWRLGMSLEGRCVHVWEKVEFAGIIKAEVKGIYVKGKRRASALVTPRTKTIFRSKSAQAYLFIQLCREMFEFDEDGERYYEKALYGFMPELFQRWKDAHVNHVVTIVIFARVYYDEQEVEYLNQLGITGREALLHSPHAGYYKDFYRVIVDFETRSEWSTILPVLKQQLLETHEAILLNHHLGGDAADEAKIIGRLSFAHEGNVLESINLVLNPFDEHHIDRDLSRTGLSIMVITPGVGYFTVNKTMLRLTTERLLDAGFTIDMICMSQIPLHVTPLFSYWSRPLPQPKREDDKDNVKGGEIMAELSTDTRGRFTSTRMHDLLYWDVPDDGTEEQLIFSVSPLLYCHFYSKSHDRPFKEDRFIPRCKMYEIQMLGLIDHDLTTLALPTLDEDEMAAKAAAEAQNLEDEHDAFDESLFVSVYAKPTEPKSKKMPTTPIPTPTILEGSETAKLQSSPPSLAKTSPLPTPTLETETVDQETLQHGSVDKELSEQPTTSKAPNLKSLATRSRSTTLSLADIPHSPKSPASTITPEVTGYRKRTISRASAHSELDKQPVIGTITAPSTPPTRVLKGKSSKSSLAAIPGASKFFNYLMGRTPINPPTPSEAIVTKENASFDKIDRSPSASQPKQVRPINSADSRRSSSTQAGDTVSESLPINKHHAVRDGAQRERMDSFSKVEPMAIPLNRARNSESGKRVKRPPKKPTYRQKDDEEQRDGNSKTSQPMNRSQSEQEVVSRSWQSGQASSWKHREAVRKGDYWRINPCQPRDNNVSKNGRHRRWQFSVPRPTFTQDVKWDSIIAPCCLPLTTDLIPLEEELRTQYREQLYHFACDANQLSFLLRSDELRDLPIAVMREMASQRLSQNFQFLVADPWAKDQVTFGQVKGIRTGGASEVLRSARGPLWLSTPNQVHRLDFALENKNTLEVHNFTRKLFYSTEPENYNCLMWPRKRKGYQLSKAVLKYPTRSNDFNYLDRLISGAEEELTDALRYWRTRFLLIPSDQPQPVMKASTGEPLREEEIHIVGAAKLLEMIGKSRWTPLGGKKDNTPPSLLPTWLDPSACVTDPFLMEQLEKVQNGYKLAKPDNQMTIHNATLESIAAAMRDPEKGLPISDRWWHRVAYPDSFQGDAFVTWLQSMYTDITTREQAVEWGQRLQKKGLIEHCNEYHGFLDGYYFYRLAGEYAKTSKKRKGLGWFSKGFADDSAALAKQKNLAVDSGANSSHAIAGPINQFGLTPPELEKRELRSKKKRKVNMSQTMILDLDPHHKSDRAEVAILHADVIHNPVNAFHFELNWIGVTAGFLDDIRQRWNNCAEKHGLRLVEAPVEQIKDTAQRCAWRAPSPIKLALAPPAIKDLDERLPEKVRTANYFEYAILTKKFDFVLDVEATTRIPDHIQVEYSYRKAGVFEYSQFIHKSGLALVQCVGGEEGFLWSDNRLFFSASSRYRSGIAARGGPTPINAATSRLSTNNHNNSTTSLNNIYVPPLAVNASFPTTIHTAAPSGYIPGQPLTKQQQADVIREKLEAFCADPVALAQFYESVTPPLVMPIKEGLSADEAGSSTPQTESSEKTSARTISQDQTAGTPETRSPEHDSSKKGNGEDVDVSLLLEVNGPYGV